MRELAGICTLSFLLASLLLPTPARALSCQQWNRLGPDRRVATVDSMIERALRSNQARQYQVNLGSVRRCLQGYSRGIEYDFDDACFQGHSAGMQAIDNIFRSYIWSCVGR